MIWVTEELSQYGGVERMVSLHAGECARAGRPTFLVAAPPIHPTWRERLKASGVDITEAADREPRTICDAVAGLVERTRSELALFTPLGESCRLWLNMTGRPRIRTLAWEMTDLSPRTWWLPDDVGQWIDGLASLIVVSDAAAAQARVRWGFRGLIGVIPGGVDRPSSTAGQSPQKSPKVTLIGRFSAEKGIDFGLAALSLAREIVPEIQVDLWGEGPERTRIEEVARMLVLDDVVRFRGTFEPGIALDRIADNTRVFMLPSLVEGRPLVVMEMAARGVPIVGSALPGVAEILGSDYPWLAAPGDSRTLANRLCTLLLDEQAHSLAASAVRSAAAPFLIDPDRPSRLLDHLNSIPVS